MGLGSISCNCINKKEEQTLVTESQEGENGEAQRRGNQNVAEAKDEQREGSAILIQAHYRGYAIRKKLDTKPNHDKPEQRRSENEHPTTIQNLASKGGQFLGSVPKFANEDVEAAETRLGSFKYDKDEAQFPDLEIRPPCLLENGAVYIGQWNSVNEREGRGELHWPDGSKYSGYWKKGKAHGRGRLIHADGDVYEGNWEEDKANGHGVYTHKDKAEYVGQWKDDMQHGLGVETWPDGTRYEGNYEMGKKHGHGRFQWADKSVYEGSFNHCVIEGHGIYYWNDGRVYDGEWKNNKMHGKGTFCWPDGRIYKGEYRNDKKHGEGEFTWQDKRHYQGGWANGRQHGRGKYTTSDGVTKEGEWIDGKRISWLPPDPTGATADVKLK